MEHNDQFNLLVSRMTPCVSRRDLLRVLHSRWLAMLKLSSVAFVVAVRAMALLSLLGMRDWGL